MKLNLKQGTITLIIFFMVLLISIAFTLDKYERRIEQLEGELTETQTKLVQEEYRLTEKQMKINKLIGELDNIKSSASIDKYDFGDYTDEEVELLASIIYAESGTEPLIGQILVAKVLINRINGDSWYGDDPSEVIFKPYQFEAIKRECFKNRFYTDTQLLALSEALKMDGYDELLYFYNKDIATNKKFVEGKEKDVEITISRHMFAR